MPPLAEQVAAGRAAAGPGRAPEHAVAGQQEGEPAVAGGPAARAVLAALGRLQVAQDGKDAHQQLFHPLLRR